MNVPKVLLPIKPALVVKWYLEPSVVVMKYKLNTLGCRCQLWDLDWGFSWYKGSLILVDIGCVIAHIGKCLTSIVSTGRSLDKKHHQQSPFKFNTSKQ